MSLGQYQIGNVMMVQDRLAASLARDPEYAYVELCCGPALDYGLGLCCLLKYGWTGSLSTE